MIYIRKALKNVDSPDSVIPPLRIYPEKIIRDTAKNVCIRIFIVVLVIMVKKNEIYSTRTGLNNLWYFSIKEY